MIIFNITCHIEKGIQLSFVEFFQKKLKNFAENPLHIEILLLKLLTEIDDQTHTYSIQLKFENRIYFQQFQHEAEVSYLNLLQNEFQGKIFTFTTVLETIH